MTLGWEWILIAWLYVFGAAAMGAAYQALDKGSLHMTDFFIIALWPVLLPIYTVIKAIYEIFE